VSNILLLHVYKQTVRSVRFVIVLVVQISGINPHYFSSYFLLTAFYTSIRPLRSGYGDTPNSSLIQIQDFDFCLIGEFLKDLRVMRLIRRMGGILEDLHG
jgi:hypothetical protein